MVRGPGALNRRERAGLVVVLVWTGWVLARAVLAGSDPRAVWPYLGAPGAVITGIVAARWLARRRDALAGLALIAALLCLALTLLRPGPAGGALGYANANAALAVQVVALAGMTLRGGGRFARILSVVAMGVGLALVALSGSLAAGVLAAGVVITVAVAGTAAPPPVVSVLAGLLGTGAATVLVVALAQSPLWPDRLLQALDPARQSLWRDAWRIWQRAPVAGVGPGVLSRLSRLGGDRDTMSAHSAVLQVGAELGSAGVALAALLVLSGFALVLRGRAADVLAACAAVAALLVHAQLDHLLEYAPILVVAGVTLGVAGAQPPSEQLDIAEAEVPVVR